MVLHSQWTSVSTKQSRTIGLNGIGSKMMSGDVTKLAHMTKYEISWLYVSQRVSTCTSQFYFTFTVQFAYMLALWLCLTKEKRLSELCMLQHYVIIVFNDMKNWSGLGSVPNASNVQDLTPT